MTEIRETGYPPDFADGIASKDHSALAFEIDGVIIPLLQKLKVQCADPTQTNLLIGLLENNIRFLVKKQ